MRLAAVCRLALVLASSLFVAAQTPAVAPAPAPAPPKPGSIASHTGWPEPKPVDVKSVDAIIAALYDSISGPAGQARDWSRFKSLFVPDAKLVPLRVLPGSPDSAHPATDAVYMSVDEYVGRSGGFAVRGFFENSVHNEVLAFGNLVDVFSTYESRRAGDDAKPFARGINSIQLLKDGERYWIINITWDAERPGNPIPAKYLPKAAASSGPSSDIYAGFNGRWVGQLEYRDYTTNERTQLPTWLAITEAADKQSLLFEYTYDDGPTKVVREADTVTLGLEQYTSISDGKATRFSLIGYNDFMKRGRGILTLAGTGMENGKPVDVRITLTLGRNLYSYLKKTRPAGEEFKFRDAYTFTRADAPAL